MTSPASTGGRVAIVTGAAQGIGKAIALRLAADGLDVIVNDISSKATELGALVEEITSHKRRSLAVVGDMSQEKDVERLVDITVEKLGGLDVMIANAGIGRSSTLVTTTVEEWERIQAVNVRSRGGRIIGACSIAGKSGAADWSAYCASKFAVRGLTQSAAAELREHEITVNAYAPGVVATPIWDDINQSRIEHGLSAVTISPPGGRYPVLGPDDIAGLVSYLVRPESKFLTGQSVNINGGTLFD